MAPVHKLINCHFFHFHNSTHNSITNNTNSSEDARVFKDSYPFPDVSFFRTGTEGFDSSEDVANREPISE